MIVDISEVLLEVGCGTTATEEERAFAIHAMRKAEAAVRRHLHYDPCHATRTEYYPQQSYQTTMDRALWEVTDTKAVMRQMSETATDELQLQHLPVRSITSINIDYDGRFGTKAGSFGSDTLKTEGDDYWAQFTVLDAAGAKVCLDGIVRALGLWPTTPGTIKVVYVAGYTEAEFHGVDDDDQSKLDAVGIWEVALDEAKRRFKKAWVEKKSRAGLVAGIMTSETLGSYSYSLDSSTVARLFGGDLTSDNKEKLSQFVNYGWSLG